MTRRTHRDVRAQLVGMLAIAAAGTAAYWIGEGASRGVAQRSSSFTAYAMAFVLAGWGLVAAATGGYNTTIGVLSVVYAVTFLGACGVCSRRS